MFGYIRPYKPDLLVREFEQYKGVYCALCKQLGKEYGLPARLALSYDSTFLCMLALSLESECTGFKKGICVVNPLKKCTFCTGGQQVFSFASAVTVLMTYYKLKDDFADSHFFGKIKALFGLSAAALAHKKAAKKHPELETIISDMMQKQNSVEQDPEAGIDASAEPTAEALSQIFKLLAGNQHNSRVLQSFGYYMGRWVYLMDAADDMEKDQKRGNFNPFVKKLQPVDEASMQQAKLYCNQVLNQTISQMLAAFQLLECRHFSAILLNIVNSGLPEMQKEILFKKGNKNVRPI